MSYDNQAAARKAQHRHTAEVQAIKLARGCVDCGYADDPAKLHFDHRPGEDKLYAVAVMSTHSRAKVHAEIAKCDIRCVWCHEARHRNARGLTRNRKVA